jgi:nucleotide-binding universal stress UspA family protein
MKTVKKILITTDFSEYSLSGLRYVLSMDEFSSAEIFLLHVVHDVILVATYPNVDLHSETIMRDSEAHAKHHLSGIVSEQFHNVSKIHEYIRRGEPSQEIIRFAEEEDVDLIVMATHGRTGLAHVLLGSIAERVVRHSPVPVLTVKPDEMRMSLSHHDDVKHMVRKN